LFFWHLGLKGAIREQKYRRIDPFAVAERATKRRGRFLFNPRNKASYASGGYGCG